MAMKSLMTCLVAGSQYLLHPQKLGTVEETIFPDALIPVTLLDTNEIFGSDLEATLRRFDMVDDVFVPTFGDVLIEKPGSNSSTGGKNQRRSANFRLNAAEAPPNNGGISRLPSGPYFLHGPNLYQAWKLYEDTLDAFAFGVIPENVTHEQQDFRTVSVRAESGRHAAVAVPSRLYFKPPSTEKPLSGVRVAVPDAVDLLGVPTGVGSRAWNEVNGRLAGQTGGMVQRLRELGAVVVGKSRGAQFGAGREWVDEKAPWSARGDGYEGVQGGAAAAMAGYKWLEAAVGLDGLDGVREPATSQGVFALRTTKDTLSLDGAQVSSKRFDSAALVHRDLAGLGAAVAAMTPTRNSTRPKRLIYPVGLFNKTENADLVDKFVAALEGETGIKAERLDVGALWAKEPPLQAKGRGLLEFLKDSPFRAYCYEFYHQYDAFRTAYQDKWQRLPYAEAEVQYRWDIGKEISDGEYSDHVRTTSIVRNWFEERVMHLTVTESWDALVMPLASKPVFRDDAPSEPAALAGITPQLLPLVLNVPEIIAPFAQVPYEARLGGQEYFSVSGAVVGPRGSDAGLVDLVTAAFQRAGWATKVETGRAAFPGKQEAQRQGKVPGRPRGSLEL